MCILYVNIFLLMNNKKQTSLFKPARSKTLRWWVENQLVYGGALNYRKVQRPFDSKKLVHVVFKARLGKSTWFTKSERSIVQLLETSACRYQQKIKKFSIQKDHIHLLVYPAGAFHPVQAKENFQNFLRFVSCEMGRRHKGLMKRLGLKSSRSLWLHRPFTRLVSWGRKSLLAAIKYIEKNTLEIMGLIEYTPRKHQLARFLKKFSQEWPTSSLRLGP